MDKPIYGFKDLKHLSQIVEHEEMESDRTKYVATKEPETKEPKIYIAMRNASCPCGSGQKFKRCCLPKSRAELEARDKSQNPQRGVRIKQASARASSS